MERSRSYSEKSSNSNNNNSTPASAHDLRCYSASYVTSKKVNNITTWPSVASSASSSSSSSSAGLKARIFGGPAELRRKRRVAGYRVYAVEGRVKGSLKTGVRWLKSKCTQVMDGWW